MINHDKSWDVYHHLPPFSTGANRISLAHQIPWTLVWAPTRRSEEVDPFALKSHHVFFRNEFLRLNGICKLRMSVVFIRPFFTFINLVLSVVRWKPPCFMATKNCVQNLSALDFPLNYSSEYSNQIVKQTTDGLYTYNLYHTQQKTVQTTFGSIINLIFPPIGWFKDNLAVETNLMAKKYGVLVMIFPIRTHPLKNEITCWIINNHNLNYGSLPVP